jgi:serine protease AprX
MHKAVSFILVILLTIHPVLAGVSFVRSSGITLTGADGITLTGADGITLTGADGFLSYQANGITLTGADGITLTGADGITLTGADAATYVGTNGITLTGADGITLTGADGITLTGADGITFTGADGSTYTADSLVFTSPSGITFTGADGITLTGADGITFTGADGITLTGADGITLTGADGITLTGADSVTGFGVSGVVFEQANPSGITLTGADGITLTGADGITFTGADGIRFTGADGITFTGADGIQSLDPELALALNNASDDSSINAILVYHSAVTQSDLDDLIGLGVTGGTKFRKLPMIYVSATRHQIAAISRLPRVRSIYGNRTLTFDADPYFAPTGINRVSADNDLRAANGGLPVTGRGVTVAVIDTGLNSTHTDLTGKVAQNVKLNDLQSAPAGFTEPAAMEGLANTDLVNGHGTFVGGIIAGSGNASGGKFAGVAPGSRLLGLSAGDLNLTHVLAGFDYLLEKHAAYNVRVVNCSFSANTVYDVNDPVNIATRMLADSGISVVFSAGNSGPGNGSLNPYAAAPWVLGVGATAPDGSLARFSSRSGFGSQLKPSLVAPGVNIASLRTVGTVTGTTGVAGADSERLSLTELPYYTTASGTSFSAPQVAGAVAMMLEADPSLTPAEIKDILMRTATPMPKYFAHEAGAGMLNTHAAVLEAKFPERRMGTFRAIGGASAIRFLTERLTTFEQVVTPGTPGTYSVMISQGTVQADFSVVWGPSANDFGLKVLNAAGTVAGESNYLNLAGLLGRRERVVLRSPAPQNFTVATSHTAGAGTSQAIIGAVDITRAEYPHLSDLAGISAETLNAAERSMLTGILLPQGPLFRPSHSVSRHDLATTLVRAGLVPQYVAAQPMFSDVHAKWQRSAIESVQSAPGGPMIFDASPGGQFRPNHSTARLAAAIAFVRSAGLEGQAASAVMPLSVTDAASIPVQWRGHVAIALDRGFLTLRQGKFDPGASLTRSELAVALVKVLAL